MSAWARLSSAARRHPFTSALVALLLLAVLLLAAVSVLLYSEPGRNALARYVEKALSTPGEFEVELGRLHGALPAEIRIDRITVADAAGAWMTVRDVRVDWAPSALLGAELRIESATAAEIAVLRRPAVREAPSGEAGGRAGISLPPLEIDVANMIVDALRLEEPLLGQAANLTLAASAAARHDRASVHLTIERMDEKAGRASAALDWNAAAGTLNVEATLAEPADGLVARFLDLPGRPPLDLSVAGEGPADDWQGRMDLEAGSLLSLESSLSISIGPEFRLAMQGEAAPGASVGPEVVAMLGPSTAFDLEMAHKTGEDDWSLTVRSLTSAAIAARGNAAVDFATPQIDGTLEVETVDSSHLARFAEPATFGAAKASIEFGGPPTHPTIHLKTAVDNLSAKGFAATQTELQAELRPDRPLNAPDVQISTDGEISFDGLETPSPELRALLGTSPRIALADALLDGYERLETGQITISGDKAEASLAGEMSLDSGVLRAAGKVTISDLAPLSARAGRALAGNVRSDFVLTRDAVGAIALSLDGSLREVGLEQPVAERLLGPEAAFSGNFRRQPDGGLSVTDLQLKGSGVIASGQLSLPPGADRLVAEYDFSVSDLEALGIADPVREGGRLGISGTASGPVTNPVLSGDLRLANAAPGGVTVNRLDAHYSVSDLPSAPRGEIRMEGETDFLPDLVGRTGFELREDVLKLSALSVSARGTKVEGALGVPLNGFPVAGNLTVRATDIAPWSDLAGRSLGGSIDGRIGLSGEGVRQDASLDATLSGLTLEEQLSVRRIDLDMRVSDLAGNVGLKGTLSARGLQGGQAQIREASLDLNGALDNLEFRLHAAGDVRARDIGLDAAGRFSRTAERTTLSVASLSGTAADIPVRLMRPANLELGPAIDSGNVELAVGEGRLQARYRQTEGGISMQTRGDAIPLASLWPAAPSQLDRSIIDVTASLDGPITDPAGRLELTVTGLAAGESREIEEGLTLAAKAELGGGRLSASGNILGLTDVAATMEASLPARLSLAPAAFTVDENTPLTGRVVYRGPVGSGWALMGLDRHKLEGQADIAVDIAGTLGTPRVSGRMELADGRYENFDTGTILTEMQISARPSDSAITIDKATAKDGGEGIVSLAGRVDFGGGELLDMDLAAKLNKARLVRRDELTAVASGQLTLRGGAAQRTVSGRIEIDEAEIRLVGGRPAGIVEIPVEETGTPPAGTLQAAPPARPSRTNLDLEISMPKRVFVRGRGLDSEWGGELKVTGTASAPRIQGELRPLRGRYDFAGKIFTLREGSIAFAGKDEIDPALDLSAERSATDITAIIHVTGTARKPEVTLESIPEYPQDEVLSRVLFNKSTGRLSAGEALQLAQAVGTLTGVSDGGGIMDFARGMLRLDVLRFSEQTEDGEGGAEAGKYLSDRIYLGVEGTAAGETGVTVEIEITPRLKLEGDIGPKDKSQTGLKWKRDY